MTSSDGKKIWYDIVGEGEPLVLIGGSSLVHRQWDFMLPILQDHFKVILYDQRGAGNSDRTPAGITVEQWVDDLKMILDEIGIDKVHLFGTSNGSLIVIRFAVKYPSKTAAIVHYGIYRFTDQYRKMSKIGATIVDEFGVGNKSMGSYFLTRIFGAPPSIEEWVTNRFEDNLSTDAWKAMHDALNVDLSVDIPKIKAPQLIIVGGSGPLGKDTDYASGLRDFQRWWPDVKIVVIGDAQGTFHVITHPQEVAKEVISFLDEHRIRN